MELRWDGVPSCHRATDADGASPAHPAPQWIRVGFGIEAVWGGEILDEAEVPMTTNDDVWPSLPLAEWQDTCATLQLWMQVVGKISLAQAPLVNHWWQVPLYVTSRGLTTSPMPFGALTFQIDFDFIDHRLLIATNDGRRANLGP